MNILILSEMFQKGGAGNATRNIFKFLKKNLSDEYKINLLIPYSKEKVEGVYSYYNSLSILFYIFIKLSNRFISVFLSLNRFYFFQKFFNISLFKADKISKKINQIKPDIIIVLWYEYILNYQEILKIKKKFNAKIILIPFDMYNFTGGCRYSQSCKNYRNSCQKCPALIDKYKYIAKKNYQNNKDFLEKINPKIIFPSIFAKKFAEDTDILSSKVKSFIINYPIFDYQIKNSPLIQKLKDKTEKKIVIFFGAQDLREWRKGVHNFVNVISILKTNHKNFFSKLVFVSVGKNSYKILKDFSTNSIFFDNLKLNELVELYDYSDLIVIPSLQEWSSLMMSEAVKLNKVIFSFNTGSSKDLIINGVNGYVFEPYEYDFFAKMIYKYCSNPDKFFKTDKLKFLEQINVKISENEILKKYKQVLFDE